MLLCISCLLFLQPIEMNNTSSVKVVPRFFLQLPWVPITEDIFNTSILSKIFLHKQETFVVGLKNCYKLIFIVSKLNSFGLEVESVSFRSQDIIGNMISLQFCDLMDLPSEMALENSFQEDNSSETVLFSTILDDGSEEKWKDIFSSEEMVKIFTDSLFTFQVYVTGSQDCYQFQLMDSLLKNQLWATSIDKQRTDVEIHVQQKSFYAHKPILAARSPVFKNLLAVDPISNDPQVITIANCDAAAVEEFLYFIYTGKLMKTAASEQLLLLAENYGIKTLKALCQIALNQIKPKISGRQVLRFVDDIKPLDISTSPSLDPQRVQPMYVYMFLCNM